MSDARTALEGLWRLAGLDPAALARAELTGEDPVVPSSFKVGAAAQASIAAAALAAAEIWRERTGETQSIGVDMAPAALECFCHYTLDGKLIEPWDRLTGLYRCGEEAGETGFVRIHANFAHHRNRALGVLKLRPGDATGREEIANALKRWRAEDFETAANEAGAAVSAGRSFAAWDRHPQGIALGGLPVMTIERIGEAPAGALPRLAPDRRPLTGVRVLDLTRILAGPVAGRTLAAYGADVMLVNSPNLPNIAAIADTSRGKLSTLIDLATAQGKATLEGLIREAHVFVQGYRPGSIAALGFGAREVARLRPGIVVAELSAYGPAGPWADRRGYDSLVQTAAGFNLAEAEALKSATPKPMPMQILDFASGFLIAYGIEAALLKQARVGGSYKVSVSLIRTANWLRSLGRVAEPHRAANPAPERLDQDYPSAFGALRATPHAARFSKTPWAWVRPSSPPGTDRPVWPER